MNHRGREGEKENEGAVTVAVHSEAQIGLDGGRSEAASGMVMVAAVRRKRRSQPEKA